MRSFYVALISLFSFSAFAQSGEVTIKEGTLNLRSEPCKTAEKLGSYGDGEKLTVIENGLPSKGDCGEGPWIKVKVMADGKTGYMMEAAVKIKPLPVRVQPVTGSKTLVRDAPCVNAKSLGSFAPKVHGLIFKQTVASSCGDGIEWAYVSIGGQMGYAQQRDLTIDEAFIKFQEDNKKFQEEAAQGAREGAAAGN